jgi:hypothetical protein
MSLLVLSDEAPIGVEQHHPVTLVAVHEARRVDFDTHPTIYLHWAALLPQRARELLTARRKQVGARRLRTIEGVLRNAARWKSQFRRPYYQARSSYRDEFVHWVERARCPVDVIACCPSSRNEGIFYLGPLANAIRAVNCEALDLSSHFAKERGYKVGVGASWDAAFSKVTFTFEGLLSSARRVLILDEVWAQGTTVGIVLSRLLQAGVPASASVIVLMALKVVQREPDALLDL